MGTQSWFPTLVYDAPLMKGGNAKRGDAKGGNAKWNRELLAECLQIRDADDEGRRWCKANYPNGYTSYASMNQLHRMSPYVRELEAKLERHVRSFARSLDFDLDGRPLEMTDCWVNVMSRDCAHGLHLHPTSTISGTYYVKTPRGASQLKFEDPRLAQQMAAPPRKPDARPANQRHVLHPVETGRVVLFESWLRHEVPPSRIQAERVSISFNWHWA